MRKWIAFILAAALCLGLWGCSKQSQYESPVQFYYCAQELSYTVGSAAIRHETREGAGMGSLEQVLGIYLAGPESEGLRSPFPAGVKLVEVRQEADTLYVTLSAGLARLSGLELVIACGCITMTCLSLTDAETVSIQAENALLNNQQAIVMDADSLLLLDDSIPREEK